MQNKIKMCTARLAIIFFFFSVLAINVKAQEVSNFKNTNFLIASNDQNLNAGEKIVSTKNNIDQIQNSISNVSQKISQSTASSNVTDSFKDELQDIQSIATQASNLQESNQQMSQSLLSTAQNKLKKLDQLIDLTNGTDDDMSGDNAAELQGLKQDIGQAEMEINKISINGADVSSLKTSLQEIKGLVSSAQDSINSKNMSTANALIKKTHDRLDNLNESIDGVLDIDYDGGRKVTRNYSNAISEVSENLQSFAEIDPELSKQIQIVATNQNNSIEIVENIIKKISARRGFIKFVFGANYSAIDQLKNQVQQNKKDIDSLKSIMDQINDSATVAVLQAQRQTMQQQTSALEVYIQNNESGYSLMGWFFRYI